MRQARDWELPQPVTVADLDIVSPHASAATTGGTPAAALAMKERVLSEAEAVRAAVSVLEALQLVGGAWAAAAPVGGLGGDRAGGSAWPRVEVRVGHWALLEAITAALQVPRQQLDQVRLSAARPPARMSSNRHGPPRIAAAPNRLQGHAKER